MKHSLNFPVNDSNFSVAFDSRVRAGTQCRMFDLVIENILTTVESSLLTISFGCFNECLMLGDNCMNPRRHCIIN